MKATATPIVAIAGIGSFATGTRRLRTICTPETARTIPNSANRKRASNTPARSAPVTAPSVVASARNVATRRLVMLSVTFLAAPAEEVAATATIEVPIASRMSR